MGGEVTGESVCEQLLPYISPAPALHVLVCFSPQWFSNQIWECRLVTVCCCAVCSDQQCSAKYWQNIGILQPAMTEISVRWCFAIVRLQTFTVILSQLKSARWLIGDITDEVLVWPFIANPIMNQMQIHNNSTNKPGSTRVRPWIIFLFVFDFSVWTQADHLKRWERWSIKWVAWEIHPYWIMTILPR